MGTVGWRFRVQAGRTTATQGYRAHLCALGGASPGLGWELASLAGCARRCRWGVDEAAAQAEAVAGGLAAGDTVRESFDGR